MNSKNLHFFTLFFLVLSLVGNLFQTTLFFIIDNQVYFQGASFGWFAVWLGVNCIAGLFVINFFRIIKYKVVFVLGGIALLTEVVHYFFFFGVVLLLNRQLEQHYFVTLAISIVARVVYACGLVFSQSGLLRWLRFFGLAILFESLCTIGIAALTLFGNQLPATLILFNQIIALIGCLTTVPLIVHFYNELRAVAVDQENAKQKKHDGLVALAGIAVFLMLVFGTQMSQQAYWRSHLSPKLKSLAAPFEARTFTSNDGDSLLYRLLKPDDYDPAEKYPLVVCLHGGAGIGDDNYRQLNGTPFAQWLSNPPMRERYPAFLFVPQIPDGTSWGGALPIPTQHRDSLVFEAIEALENEFSVDQSRIYVTGHSLGAYGTWYFIGTRPDIFAAAIPTAGEGDPSLAANMTNVAIWAFHGAKDNNVPVSGSRNMITAIKAAGGNPRYTESPDARHGWQYVKDTPDVLEWLFAQKKQ